MVLVADPCVRYLFKFANCETCMRSRYAVVNLGMPKQKNITPEPRVVVEQSCTLSSILHLSIYIQASS